MLGPIFNREWLILPRRPRHYVSRAAFLGTLWVIAVTAWLSSSGWMRTATLGETARLGPVLFQLLTLVQLSLFLFFAALSAASAISLEKDRRTFVLLLLTDLRNREIVLGKLLGSLLPIAILVVAAVPLQALLLLLGGVSLEQILQAFLVVSATVLASGSLGGLVALWRDRTFQALALTTLFLVLYLCLVRALPLIPGMPPEGVRLAQQWLDPFAAIGSVLDPLAVGETVVAPAYAYAACMVLLSASLNGYGMARLRVWNPSGEPLMQREQPGEAPEEEEDRAKAHAAPGRTRHVTGNPILWREVYTRAYGRRPLLVKLAYFVALGFIAYATLTPVVTGTDRTGFVAAYGLVPVAVLSLLLLAAQAVTAITSERDTGALDLLLVTDLSPREFVYGKLLGILYNAKEFLIPPLLLAGLYAWFKVLAVPPAGRPDLAAAMNVSSLLCLGGGLLVLMGFVMVLGVHVALRTANSRLAIINTLSTIFFLSVGTLVTVALILINGGRFEYQWASFVFFLAAGIGGLWWVFNGERPSTALTVAAWACPLGVFYTVVSLLVAKPGSPESADPLLPFVVMGGAFGFAIAAMLVPLVSEFDVAMGRTSGGAD